MAPPIKSKKSKKVSKKKLKKKKLKNKNITSVPIDPSAIDSDWWDTFWLKNSSSPGSLDFFFLFSICSVWKCSCNQWNLFAFHSCCC
ncbi:hypothetical protein OIU78_012605 [Salix suchowensis]|nr:hypothetical protein OIU78_012605 [Salix suchowensis]